MRLKKFKEVKGKIRVMTGLHIGAGQERLEIGGNDNPIIKNPRDGFPYIPGSSLKGRIRSLLEFKLDKVERNGDPHKWCKDPDCPICRIFGTSSGEEAKIGPTRAIFRDAFVSEKSKKDGILLTEDKNENSLNRITAEAKPRPIERVIPGVEFDFEIIYRIFVDGDGMQKSDEELFEYLLAGLKLLEMDALGGGVSRGNGKIKFIELRDENEKPINLKEIDLAKIFGE